ncbi:histidine kinase [uncultured Marivirga sp.]|uniref:sensor histidine kinase n=1 Tax=uncultured Marivirga sp. TaxID=1123707 RepID=UPI0030ED5A92|tara:strand:+ start:42261 stop:43265 length:1005 start_codon:yes stop_codon:yes gene_type:complete
MQHYLYHIAFWLLSFLLCAFLISYDNNWNEALLLSLIYLPVTIACAYLISNYLIPKYLLKDKKLRFVLYVVYLIISAIFLTLLINTVVFIVIADYQFELMPPGTRDIAILNTVLFLIVFLFVAITSIDKWRTTENEKNEAIKNMAQAELRFLKSQLNPHFLFNTMNNLYALSLKKSDKAPELILRLSALLEYILENSKKDLILLSDEISTLEDYIHVESFRFGDRLEIEKNLEVPEDAFIKIPPLILITLMENCFKHGGINNTGKLKIKYSIKSTDRNLLLSFSNNFLHNESNPKAIGLKNIESQLSYIYKEEYKMEKSISEGNFKIEIQIPVK